MPTQKLLGLRVIGVVDVLLILALSSYALINASMRAQLQSNVMAAVFVGALLVLLLWATISAFRSELVLQPLNFSVAVMGVYYIHDISTRGNFDSQSFQAIASEILFYYFIWQAVYSLRPQLRKVLKEQGLHQS